MVGPRCTVPVLYDALAMPALGGVLLIAVAFFAAAVYLAVTGAVMLLRPGAISMVMGAFLLHGLETAGPYMFLLAALLATLTGVGLLRRNNWARRAAAIIALVGVVMEIPTVSASVVSLHLSALAWGGLGIIVRVMMAWYLYQTPVRDYFEG
jgi:hypothetical protein